MSLKTLALIASGLFIINAVHADTTTLDKNAAHQAIQQYKTLRSECAQAKGEARKQCFSKLSASTKKYKLAKQFLGEAPAGSASRQGNNTANLADIK